MRYVNACLRPLDKIYIVHIDLVTTLCINIKLYHHTNFHINFSGAFVSEIR